jgi:hypothetical protein
MKTIYTFGDSHTGMFHVTNERPGFVAPIDPKVVFVDKSCTPHTAYNLSEHDSVIKGVLSSIEFKPGDEMWFVFGEIDVRFHVFYEHQERNILLDQSILNTSTRYINYVKTLTDLGYPISIVSIVPPQRCLVPHRYDPLHHLTMLNPVRGKGITNADRIYMTETLNSQIKYKCSSLGIGFVDIYPFLVDHDGCIKADMTFDNGMHSYYIGDLVIDKYNLE